MKTCLVDGCERHVDSRGMCSRHYRQWSRAHPEEIRRGSYRSAQDPDNPLTVRVQTKVSEQLAQRLDEAREERSRSEYLRELLTTELDGPREENRKMAMGREAMAAYAGLDAANLGQVYTALCMDDGGEISRITDHLMTKVIPFYAMEATPVNPWANAEEMAKMRALWQRYENGEYSNDVQEGLRYLVGCALHRVQAWLKGVINSDPSRRAELAELEADE